MTELVDVLEQQYADKLALRCTEWQVRHPDEAKVIRERVIAGFRANGKPDPEPGSLVWMMVESQVCEAVRVRNKWPTIREFILGQPVPAAPMRPAVTTADHKAIAAGERE